MPLKSAGSIGSRERSEPFARGSATTAIATIAKGIDAAAARPHAVRLKSLLFIGNLQVYWFTAAFRADAAQVCDSGGAPSKGERLNAVLCVRIPPFAVPAARRLTMIRGLIGLDSKRMNLRE
jgi:hypothetical protein